MIDFDNFNWLVALQQCIDHQPTVDECIRLVDKAGHWPTCACGQLCDALPRGDRGQPLDEDLFEMGHLFNNRVAALDWKAALQLFIAIEHRVDGLLREELT